MSSKGLQSPSKSVNMGSEGERRTQVLFCQDCEIVIFQELLQKELEAGQEALILYQNVHLMTHIGSHAIRLVLHNQT